MDIIQHSGIKREISPIFLFALTLFCSASLMFFLQPMFGKSLLPLLGGSASVWNTCMVFYQSILFLGYLYAHFISNQLGFRTHLLIHIGVLLLSLAFIPIGLSEEIQPPTHEEPGIWLLLTMSASIGLPFFILSTTSPLLQKWFSTIGHHTSHDPYYLSIASNSGSLLALMSYPFLLEPILGIADQQYVWSIGFIVLCALIALCMFNLKKQEFEQQRHAIPASNLIQTPNIKLQLHWLILAFVPSSLLLGTTNFISIDIATVPLLWVIPLAIYLLSFILVFSSYSHLIHQKILFIQPWVVTPFLIYFFSNQKLESFSLELLMHLLIFFISVMVCHGELAKNRPAPQYLTQYYLIMSLGGMLGGIFNSFVAPFIFNSIYEYPLMMISALVLNPINNRLAPYLKEYLSIVIFITYLATFAFVFFNHTQFSENFIIGFLILGVMLSAYYFFKRTSLYLPLVGLLAISCSSPEKHQGKEILHQSRNFYGVLSVKKIADLNGKGNDDTYHEIYSGTTKHGLQLVNDVEAQCTPNGYYSPVGPLGSIFYGYNEVNRDWKIGVIGLGAGEMAGYAKTSQDWTFFEINPAVVDIATDPKYFTYLSNCIDNYNIELGDARITLENQQQRYDLLVIDAFTSDSIPTHLLTREALELYISKLNPQGLLVFHISNRHLDLQNVLANHAEGLSLTMLIQKFKDTQNKPLVYRSDWVVMANNQAALEPLKINDSMKRWETVEQTVDQRSWTDDYTSILSVWKEK